MKLREYKTTDCEQMAKLFYNTVHSVNAKDYTEEQEVDMIKIVWSINDINKYQTGNLSEGAVKIETPQSVGELMKKAVPIAAILCVFLFIAMLCKTIICKTVVISPIFILVGFAFGFILLIIHEWLHGIVYPKEADVTIGRIKGKTTFVALASYPLKRNRFILMCLLPFVLGLVPFILFVISPAEFRVFNGLNFGMACMGMVSPFPDVFNVLAVLRNSEKSDSIMFYKNDMYKIS